jgi:branched-chain amino acid transport system substrate-binding protein
MGPTEFVAAKTEDRLDLQRSAECIQPKGRGVMMKLMHGAAFSFVIALAGSAHADVTVAVAGPLTGLYAALGAQVKAGADQWAADINKAGGLLGQRVVVEVKDDGCDAGQAVTVANQFAIENVAVVIGHVCSAASIAASKVYAEKHIVEISPASTNPKFTDERPGPGVMRVCGRDDRQAMTAGEFLAWRFNDSNIAIVDDKSTYGKGLSDETRKVMNKAGKKEVLNDEYDDGGRDYSALVNKLKAANVDVLYLGGYHPEAAIILKEMRDHGMKTILVSGDSMLNAAFWRAEGEAAEGTLVTFPPDPRRSPNAKSVVAEFRSRSVDPEGYTLYAYGALQAWTQAVETAKATTFDPVVAALQKGTFRSVLGEFHFNDKGDVNLPSYVVYQWNDGAYDYYVASK